MASPDGVSASNTADDDDRSAERIATIPSRNLRPARAQVFGAYAGDPVVSWLLDKRQIKPYQLGALTFCLGFATLAIWYAVMERVHDPATRFKGIYDYYAASYGDALLLPLLSAVIVLAYRTSAPLFADASLEERERIRGLYANGIATALTVVVSLIGIAIAYVVLPSRAHEPSWTSPAYGKLNAVGWYHALFMFSQFYLLLGFLLREWLTLFVGWRHRGLVADNRSAWARHARVVGWFVIAIAAFSGLLAIDEVYIRLADPTWADVLRITLKHAAVSSVYAFGVPLFLLLAVLARGRMSPRIVPGLVAMLATPVVTVVIVFASRVL